jgi:hypothetical protein
MKKSALLRKNRSPAKPSFLPSVSHLRSNGKRGTVDARIIMQEILGLVLRMVGLCLMGFAIYDVLYSLFEIVDLLPHPSAEPAHVHSFFGLVYWCAGCAVVAVADRTVKWVYKIKV